MSDKYPGGFVTANAPAGFSVAFDGNGDSLTAPQGSAFQFPGDFTIECWVYANNSVGGASYDGVFDTRSGNVVSSNSAGINYKDNGYLNMYVGGTNTSSSTLLGAKQWVHVALVRSGSSVVMYQNGVSVATATNSANLSDGYCTIGGFVAGGYWNGYISNVRVVKGTAVYTTTFTPPTQLFPITNTSLLTCQSPTLVDNSTNNFTITANGDAKVSNFTPFAGYTGFNPALGAAAGGVWTLDEAAYYQNNRQWPIYDPYFNNTTLMLHGNGTNGAQNNTFLDSSTNNFTITRNGNTTQGTFTPFSQTGWSNYFTSAGLSIPYASSLQLQNTNWTIESYFNLSSNSAEFCVMGASNGGGGVPKYFMGGNWSTSFTYNANRATFFTYTGADRWIDVPFTWQVGQWYHMAAVYTHSNTTITLYINGVSVGSMAYGIGNVTGNILIGRNGENGGPINGYISNFRYIVGTSLYTSNFTPSTTPLTAITNTQILTCQSNSFVDNSANIRTVSVSTGTPSVQAFSPFVPAYITPTTYSNWFDGTGDYLSSSSANYTATGDFTAEAWFYATSNPSFGGIINTRPQTNTTGWAIVLDSTQKIRFYINGTDFPSGFVSYNLNQWYHVALVRSGSTVTGYINGISVGTTTNSSTTSTTDLVIGRFYSDLDNYYLNGVVSNARFVNGTALYTANFTPPNAPFPTGTTNQQLLTCQASTLIDSNTYTTAKTITANGNVQPVTSPTPFPANVDTTTLNSAYSTSLIGGSAYFDGSGDYLNFTGNANTSIGGNDWTVEAWVYCTSFSQQYQQILRGETSNIILLMLETTAKRIQCEIGGGSSAFSPTTLQLNTWTHCAAVRSGSNVTVYINGVGGTPVTMNPTTTTTEVFRVGTDTSLARWLNGYVCGLRMVKGTALYTQNFAPPTLPPTAVTNTQLLLNYTNGAIFDNTAKNVLETVGNAQISTTQSKWGGSSMYFDGTGDYLLYRSNALSSISGDFTVEGWIYPVSWGSNSIIIGQTSSSQIGRYGSSGTAFGIVIAGGWVITDAALPSTSVWTHFAVVRQNGVVKIYINGTQSGSSASNTGILSMNCVGSASGSGDYNGYIDDLRVTNCARYLTNFTPPTSQLQDQ